MKRLLLMVACMMPCLFATAQVVRGKVLAEGSEEPVRNASIYYDGMYRGGISDENGNFNLASAGGTRIPIIISAVGYFSASVENYKLDEPFVVRLRPRTYSLDEVTVTYDGMSRGQKERIFLREFIGVSAFSSDCKILNLDDVTLTYLPQLKAIEAFCNKPIIIQNKALGFKISYDLISFITYPGRVSYKGTYFFEEDTISSGIPRERIKLNREKAYWGSRMHFVRSLYNGTLRLDGYKIFDENNKPVNQNGLVRIHQEERNLHLTTNVKVVYQDDVAKVTLISRKKPLTFINNSGYYDSDGVVWNGGMAEQRMADLLPFEYRP